jgi:integrator complex subunit 11
MRKVAVERKGETNFFTSAHIKDCMKKVIAVTLHQTVQVNIVFDVKKFHYS